MSLTIVGLERQKLLDVPVRSVIIYSDRLYLVAGEAYEGRIQIVGLEKGGGVPSLGEDTPVIVLSGARLDLRI